MNAPSVARDLSGRPHRQNPDCWLNKERVIVVFHKFCPLVRSFKRNKVLYFIIGHLSFPPFLALSFLSQSASVSWPKAVIKCSDRRNPGGKKGFVLAHHPWYVLTIRKSSARAGSSWSWHVCKREGQRRMRTSCCSAHLLQSALRCLQNAPTWK